jgi:carbon monoxide dehydrogenase subunit G
MGAACRLSSLRDGSDHEKASFLEHGAPNGGCCPKYASSPEKTGRSSVALQLTDEYVLPVDRVAVYAALNDPETLKQCIPGCEQLEQQSDHEFSAVVRLELGPLKARFRGKVRLENRDPPNGYRIVGEGEGGVAGFAKGGATVTLADVPDGTKLTYHAEATVGGKIAQLGQRMLAGTVKKLADRFFKNIAAVLTEGRSLTSNPAV